ncbi:sulfatase family protein [Seonamhaeicola maritimus]|uniref:sulfatase family protein n=1 Tax=Seonamhaeicola maritimus TaxID=2591822 RepID=UPI0024944BFB|nr:sulfatase-like hydrolase/transferase [Seonamhaeicola maritimus]
MLLLCIVALFSCGKTNKSQETKNELPAKPNILLIIGDDQGYADLSVTGLTPDVETPGLDKLSSEGVRFTNAYASSPICNNSRMALMTGAYHQRQGATWYGGPGLSDSTMVTLAEWLGKEGYATGHVGKFHYGHHDANTEHRSFPLNHGYDELFGFFGGRKHYLIHDIETEAAFKEKMKKAEGPKQSLEMGGFFQQDKKVNAKGFSTEIFGDRARKFIGDKNNAGKPFFLTLAFNAVHNFTHQLPESYLKEKGLKGFRDWDPAGEEKYHDWYKASRVPNNPEGRAHYLGQLHFLDKEVGKMLDYLDQNNLRENTIVIYIVDNGGSTQIYANNTPLAGGKYMMYEGGLRVPLVISWPGQYDQNKVEKTVISSMDVFPTICQAIGLDIPKTVEGKELHNLLQGKENNAGHDELFWYGGGQSAARVGNWKYRWADEGENSRAQRSNDFEGVAIELGEFLFDLNADPSESTNLIKENPAKAEELKAKLEAWKTEVGLNSK